MNSIRIDAITRLLADRKLSRRQSMASETGIAAGVAKSKLQAAQDASPVASSNPPDAQHGPEMLFVQSFQSGSIVPKDGVEGRFTITLEHGLGETIYFSDRPDRIVGSTPTATFLDGLGFSDENPPNAAILTQNPDGDTTLAVVELFTPVYDDATHSVTYDLAVLDHWQEEVDLGFSVSPVDLDALGATFGATHLFIDDCADLEIICITAGDIPLAGTIPNSDHAGFCYSMETSECLPCQPWYSGAFDAIEYWSAQCNARFSQCGFRCEASNVAG